ncbi:hypothetical protein VCV18_001917 [Metarhizium anisopliae]
MLPSVAVVSIQSQEAILATSGLAQEKQTKCLAISFTIVESVMEALTYKLLTVDLQVPKSPPNLYSLEKYSDRCTYFYILTRGVPLDRISYRETRAQDKT